MTVIVEKPLPHGNIPFHHISDPNVRNVVMKVNENIAALERANKALAAAVRELQRK